MAERQGTTGDQSVTARILAAYDTLPNSERHIADYVLSHQSAVSDMTARDIAQASGSSAATMSRFVKSLGFSSFAQLRFTLARDAQDQPGRDLPLASRFSLDRLDDAIDDMLSVKEQELTATANNLKGDDLGRAVELIREADMTVFAGVGNTITVAQNAAFKLTQTGHRAMAPETSDGSALAALTLTERDVLVVISSSGYSKRLVQIIENAHDSGAPVVAVCGSPESQVGKRADILLQTASHDRMLTEGLRFGHIPEMFVVELITILLYYGSSDSPEFVRMFDRNMLYDRRPGEGVPEGGDRKENR